ncbi:flagellar protein FlaG [Thermomonas brevis]|uniref:Flagellar protein FlaG n=1 Tax=Thermomonas brevis TaxID=215691 RepID=A0A7G9QTN2_9GAMM|nr:flagellar protein FlaG [Thermomonas brevis]
MSRHVQHHAHQCFAQRRTSRLDAWRRGFAASGFRRSFRTIRHLPARDAQAEPPPPPQKSTTPSELQKQIEATLAESRVQTNLKFRVDEDLRRVVVSVVDSDTGETILQIPDEAALAVARRLADTGTGLLDQKA